MRTRLTGALGALVVTAALLCVMPGLMKPLWNTGGSRVDDSLRPARLRTLTVWLLPGDMDDRRIISRACAAYEKQNGGVRIFLRAATQEELYAADAVLPDVLLFQTGSVAAPEDVLLPLDTADEADASGLYAGVRYALPLWLEPNVLQLPAAFVAGSTPAPASLFGQEESAGGGDGIIAADALPWNWLLQPGALEAPDGIALQQLLFACPAHLRQTLVDVVLGRAQATPAPSPISGMPAAQGRSPTPMPTLSAKARVRTLAQHLDGGGSWAACILPPAVSTRVRYAALCKSGGEGAAFLTFLRTWDAQGLLSAGLLPMQSKASGTNAAVQAALDLFAPGAALPSAFAHTAQEITAICRSAFERAEDPALTLLTLR